MKSRIIVTPLVTAGEMELSRAPQTPECLEGEDPGVVVFCHPEDELAARYLLGDRSEEVVRAVCG